MRVMTYNVHGCRGTDGRVSVKRIARVISQYEPDIVALQELDQRRPRSGAVDQPHRIAHYLQMAYHFHPTILTKEGHYGNAVLSRFPIQLVKAAPLPRDVTQMTLEVRGVMWVSIKTDQGEIQLLNTHLGLNRKERHRHAQVLLGKDWLNHPSCQGAIVLCGDFNCWSQMGACRQVKRLLKDAQHVMRNHRPRATWFSHFPIFRIDHIFINPSIHVSKVLVPRTNLSRQASDHLPLIAEMKL